MCEALIEKMLCTSGSAALGSRNSVGRGNQGGRLLTQHQPHPVIALEFNPSPPGQCQALPLSRCAYLDATYGVMPQKTVAYSTIYLNIAFLTKCTLASTAV